MSSALEFVKTALSAEHKSLLKRMSEFEVPGEEYGRDEFRTVMDGYVRSQAKAPGFFGAPKKILGGALLGGAITTALTSPLGIIPGLQPMPGLLGAAGAIGGAWAGYGSHKSDKAQAPVMADLLRNTTPQERYKVYDSVLARSIKDDAAGWKELGIGPKPAAAPKQEEKELGWRGQLGLAALATSPLWGPALFSAGKDKFQGKYESHKTRKGFGQITHVDPEAWLRGKKAEGPNPALNSMRRSSRARAATLRQAQDSPNAQGLKTVGAAASFKPLPKPSLRGK